MIKLTLKKMIALTGFELRRIQKEVEPPSLDQVKLDGSISDSFTKYHIGCGDIYAEGFLNIDADPRFEKALEEGSPYKIDKGDETYILKHDLRKGIPAKDSSLDYIYHCHFLEHLTDEEGTGFLQDCYRSLSADGMMRFALPDLRIWIDQIQNNNTQFFDRYRNSYLRGDETRYKTPISVLAGMLYNWGHSCMYDFETLEAQLKDIGFTQVNKRCWGESDQLPNIKELEEEGTRAMESLVIECSKH